MEMTDADIVLEYRQAKRKSEQIGILADLNGCTKAEIKKILFENGEIEEEELEKAVERKPKRVVQKKKPLVSSAVIEHSPSSSAYPAPEREKIPDEIYKLVQQELDALDLFITQKHKEIEDAEARYTILADYLKGKR